jgi:Acetyltransferase (GNAT) domain
MKVNWDTLSYPEWDAHHAAAAAPLQQDWAYGACMKTLGVGVLRALVEQDGAPVALAQFIVRRLVGGLANMALCSLGPVWLQPLSGADKARVYKALKKTIPLKNLRVVAFTPLEAQGPELGLSSWRRVMTGHSTVTLDLQPDPETLRAQLDGRWRYSLARAEESPLIIHRVGTNAGQYRWLLDAEMQQREQRGLHGLPLHFFDLYVPSRQQPAKTILTMRADVGRDRVAGMMFLIHGEAATYQVGWTSDTGREQNAHNLILWNAIQELRERGVRKLDLGGVNTTRSAGIARFKIGTGGQVLSCAGTYI